MVPDDSTPEGSTPADPTPDNVDEPEAEMLPENPAEKFRIEAPRAPDTTTNDADPELRKRFWTLVILFNVALLGISLGVMLVGFEGRWLFGGGFFAVGVIAFLRGWLGYRDATNDADG